MWKIVAIVVVVLVVAGVAARYAFARGGNEATEVRVHTMEPGDLTVTVTAPGEIRAETRVSLSARTSAAVLELPVEEGDVVAVDQVLVRLDDADAAARLRAAKANRDRAVAELDVARARLKAARAATNADRASLAEAEADLERVQQLAMTDDVALREVEAARARVGRLRAQTEAEALRVEADAANLIALDAVVDAADAEISRAEENLAYTVIRSPIDGTVTKVNAEVGETVVVGTMNNQGTVILEVADLSRMICVAEVDEASVADLELDAVARVRSAAYGDDVVIPGTVRSIALGKTQDTRSGEDSGHYEVEVLLDLAAVEGVKLFSGLTADVEFVTREHTGVLVLPSQAVVSRAVDRLPDAVRDAEEVARDTRETPVVFRIDNGVVRIAPVRLGDSDLLESLVESGLSEGDEVVAGPFAALQELNDGDAVTPTAE
jgi:HlyD family secretion protein